MTTIKVSVIIPVYNKEKYLKECLNSIINQTLKEIEIICIDDGSTDNSHKILEQYQEKHPNLKIITQKNKGPGSARNQGIKKAQGQYIAFIDADDWIEKETLEQLYKNAQQHKSELVLFNAIEHLPNNNTMERIYFKESIEGIFDYKDRKDIVMNNYLIVCTKLHKTAFIQKNNLQFSETGLFEDVYFHIKSMIKAQKVTYINKIFYNYRRTQTNTRQNNSIKSRESFIFINILQDIKELLQENNTYDELEENYQTFKLTELNNIFHNIYDEHKEEFYLLIKKDFQNNPISQQTLEKLPTDKQKFYKEITESKNFKEYKKLSDKEHSNDSTLKNIIKSVRNIF